VSRRHKADLALTFCMLIWGATFVSVKEALADASVFVFLAMRFVLAAVLMAVIYRSALRKLTRSAIWAGAQIGFFLFAGYGFQTVGMKDTTPSKAAFITGSGVVLVPVLLFVVWRRRINRWAWAGAVAVLVGLYYLTVPAAGFRELNRGDLLVVGAAALFALHIIFVSFYTSRHSVAALSFLQVVTTGVLTALAVPVLAVTGGEAPRLHWTGSLGSAILVTAVGATAIGFSLQVWAQQYTPPTHTAILFSLEPVFAGLTSFLVLGERLGARALFGAALIFAGILLAELTGPTPAVAESAAPVPEAAPRGS